MRIEDFGFQPEVGKQYSISFTQDGELLNHIVYNGSDLGPLSFKDNSTITLTITDYETGKLLLTTDFVAYNGKLYKKVFKLPLQDEGNNMNANVHIKDLHYDLTTASILVQVQGFVGEEYKLVVSGTTTDLPSMSMPITLEDNMHYSIATELVQGSPFSVTLFDQYDTQLDVVNFTAPISTDWRFNESNELKLEDETDSEDPSTLTPIESGQPPTTTEGDLTQQGTLDQSGEYAPIEETGITDSIFFKAGIGLVILIILILIIKKLRKPKSKKDNSNKSNQQEEYIEDDDDEADLDVYEDHSSRDEDLDVVSSVLTSTAMDNKQVDDDNDEDLDSDDLFAHLDADDKKLAKK